MSCDKLLGAMAQYETIKVARVQDMRLAAVRGLCLLGALGYVLYQMLFEFKYAAFDIPYGQSNVELQYNSEELLSKQHAYCRPNGGFECLIWDDQEFVFGSTLNELFITTHLNRTHQERNNCSIECTQPWEETSQSENFYISDVEDWSLKITTTFQDASVLARVAGNSMTYHYTGKLVDQEEHTIKEFGKDKSDEFTVTQLMQAAGVSLDETSDWTSNYEQYTFRTWGMLLIVHIEMNNKGSWGSLVEPYYTYKVERISEKKFEMTESSPPLAAQNDTARTLYKRYGIKAVFQVTGTLGVFDPMTFLLTIVSASALLSASTLVVDFFMLQVSSNKEVYRAVKIDEVGNVNKKNTDINSGYQSIVR